MKPTCFAGSRNRRKTSPEVAFQMVAPPHNSEEPPVATMLPSGKMRNLRCGARSPCWCTPTRSSPEAALQMLTEKSAHAAATRSPSGKTCTSRITAGKGAPPNTHIAFPDAALQIVIAPPESATRSLSPWGKNCMAFTTLSPLRTWGARPESAFQRMAALLLLEEATCGPQRTKPSTCSTTSSAKWRAAKKSGATSRGTRASCGDGASFVGSCCTKEEATNGSPLDVGS
mmetsp:Transcript_87424/g.252426  ORF Transcript_87424/g.252426 Transcript_87424/m.252426 type:complete len:229 (-) Transcript_87424:106-792(-)